MGPLIDTAVAPNVKHDVTPAQISWEKLGTKLSRPVVGEKKGSMFVLAKLPPGPCKDDYVEHVSAIVFDIDNKISPPLTILQTKEKINSAGFKAIMHSTYSHTVDTPHFRIILSVDKPILPESYRSVCESVATKLGIAEHIDKACLHSSRRYFEPRCPEECKNEYEFIAFDGEPISTDDYLPISTDSTVVNLPKAD